MTAVDITMKEVVTVVAVLAEEKEMVELLESSAAAREHDRSLAGNSLHLAAEANFPEFVRRLSEVLRNSEYDSYLRHAAGLQLINVLISKDDEINSKYYQQRWLAVPADVREFVKKSVLETLGTNAWLPFTDAQCVAAIACAELPTNSWQQCIPQLMQNVTNPSSTKALKESSLEALGYICRNIDSTVLSSRSTEILMTFIHAMEEKDQSIRVRLAATEALANALEFLRATFENENDRNMIMRVVCEASQMTDTSIRVAALQSLVKIVSLYYQLVEPYMEQSLIPVTLDAIKSDDDKVCLQAIEFWSHLCDEELKMASQAEEAGGSGQPPVHTSKFYAKGAFWHLVPLLMEIVTRRDESERKPATAARNCLMVLSKCVDASLQMLKMVQMFLDSIQEDSSGSDRPHSQTGESSDGKGESDQGRPGSSDSVPWHKSVELESEDPTPSPPPLEVLEVPEINVIPATPSPPVEEQGENENGDGRVNGHDA